MFRRALPLCLGLAMLVPVALAAQDPAVVAPTVYRQALDNERVRTFVVSMKPGEEVALHGHPDHLIYVIAGGKVRFTDKDGKSMEMELKTGETHFLPAGSHAAKNLSRKTIQGYMVELKEPATAAMLSSAERAEILALYDRSRSELESLIARTPDDLWAKKPAPDRWSVSEVVEHLAVVEKLLGGMVAQTLQGPVDPNWVAVESARSIDTILAAGTDRSKKMKSPEAAAPKGGMSRADLLAMYGGARTQNEELVRRTSAEVKKHTGDVPNGGTMTMHQLLAYIAIHNLRHNAQIAEALAQLGAK